MTDLFNWYVVGTSIRGDACLHHYRREEYIQEKLAYKSPDLIAKKDKGDRSRVFMYVQEQIKGYNNSTNTVTTRLGNTYELQNIDSYFLPRRHEQISILSKFTS